MTTRRVRLNLLTVDDAPIETIEIEADAMKVYHPNDWVETPGGDVWIVAEVRATSDGMTDLDVRWLDGTPDSPYREQAQ